MGEEKESMPIWITIFLLALIICGAFFVGDRYEIIAAENVAMTVLIAVIISFLGYLKSTPPESFDPVKFMVTPIVGVIAGIMTALYGYTYAETTTWLISSGLMLWIEFLGKALVRRVWAVQAS